MTISCRASRALRMGQIVGAVWCFDACDSTEPRKDPVTDSSWKCKYDAKAEYSDCLEWCTAYKRRSDTNCSVTSSSVCRPACEQEWRECYAPCQDEDCWIPCRETEDECKQDCLDDRDTCWAAAVTAETRCRQPCIAEYSEALAACAD